MIVLSILSGTDTGKRFELDVDLLRIGSAEDNDIVLHDEGVEEECLRVAQTPEYAAVQVAPEAHPVLVRWKGHSATIQPGELQVVPDETTVRLTLREGAAGDDEQPIEIELLVQADRTESRVLSMRPIGQLGEVRRGLQQDPRIFTRLDEVQRRVVASVDLDEVLRVIGDGVLELVPGATHVTIALRGDRGMVEDGKAVPGLLVPVLTRVRGKDGRGEAPSGPVPVARSVLRRVVENRAAVLAADAPKDMGKAASILGASIRSTVAVPLWERNEIIGAIQADNRMAPAMLREVDLDLLAVFASSASLAVSNARLVRELRLAHQRLSKENEFLRTQRGPSPKAQRIIGESLPMKRLLEKIDKVVDTRVTVLIEGETGTGKELVAAAIHERSRRRNKPFVIQNCAAFPSELLESELFGHKRGAFTGAVDDKKGLFDLADGGTLFLDEIGELPLPLQSKLLRVVQEGEVRPIGASKAHHVDVRIVAATNRDLQKEVEQGRFRQDLYYRLKVFPLTVPPLRDRRDDIPLLAKAFVERYAREMGKRVAGFAQQTLELMMAYDWPGNVRELQNEVQRLVIQADDGQYLTPDLLSAAVRGEHGVTLQAGMVKGTLKQMMTQVEKYLLLQALAEHGGNKTRTAKALGITREGLHKKLRAHGIK